MQSGSFNELDSLSLSPSLSSSLSIFLSPFCSVEKTLDIFTTSLSLPLSLSPSLYDNGCRLCTLCSRSQHPAKCDCDRMLGSHRLCMETLLCEVLLLLYFISFLRFSLLECARAREVLHLSLRGKMCHSLCASPPASP